MSGWLLGQLPRAMSGNPVVQAFVAAAEHTGDSLRAELDGLEHQLDADLATPEMLAYLAGWLGFPLDRLDDPALHRPLLRALGRLLLRRGTPGALRALFAELTGGPVEVQDGGGVFRPGEPVPPESRAVRIELSRVGEIDAERLTAIAEQELPVGVRLELVLPAGPQREGRS